MVILATHTQIELYPDVYC